MVNYNQFNTTNDTAFNIRNAILYCKEHRESKLVFDKGTYHIRKNLASEKFFSVSNHTDPGLRRICFLIDEMSDFTIDGGGSEFVFEDPMTPFAIDHSANIRLENLSLSSKNTLNFQCEVLNSGSDWAEMKVTAGSPCFTYGGDMYAGDPDGEYAKCVLFDECDRDTGWLVSHVGDTFYHTSDYDLHCTTTPDGLIRIDGLPRQIPVGNVLNFATNTRRACQILINESSNVFIQDVDLYSGIGMGVIAQNSENIFIERFNTLLRGGRRYSINADATHFVHCRGQIRIRNCFFEGQLDDALNVHSIYLKIIGKTDRSLLLQYGHPETRGIQILHPGSIVQTVDPASQLPNGEYTVTAVRKVNLDSLEVELDGDLSPIRIGDLIDEISWKPDVLFENCVVRNNRARGMLLSSGGRTVIRDNQFQTPGCAILFESSGDGWYESGGVKDVLITGNVFDNCRYAQWGQAVIEVIPRRRTEEGRFYHGKIAVTDNTFRDCSSKIAIINNTEEFIFEGNRLTDNHFEAISGSPVETEHCGSVQIDMP